LPIIEPPFLATRFSERDKTDGFSTESIRESKSHQLTIDQGYIAPTMLMRTIAFDGKLGWCLINKYAKFDIKLVLFKVL